MLALIASLGPLVLDVTIAPEGQLRLDDDRDASIEIGGGGQAANFCAWCVALGEPARLITKVGRDALGRRLVEELQESGVEVCAAHGHEPTGAIAVLLGPEGERTFARQSGASLQLTEDDLQEGWLERVDLLHLPAYSLFKEPIAGAARKAVATLRSRNARAILSVDLSSAADIEQFGGARFALELTMLRPELLFASEREAAALQAPLEGIAKVPVIKRGANGARIFERNIPAHRVALQDATGAGDAFAAAFCSAYLDGASPLEAAGRAVLVGAQAVERKGARP